MCVEPCEGSVVRGGIAPRERGRIAREATQDRVRETGSRGADRANELDALVDARRRRSVGEQQLVGGDLERVANLGLEPLRLRHARIDGLVERALGLDRSVCEPRCRRGISLVEPRTRHTSGTTSRAHARRSRMTLTAARAASRRWGRAHAGDQLVRSVSRAPRAHAPASIAALPSGFSRVTRMAPSRQPERQAAFSTAARARGEACLGPGRGQKRQPVATVELDPACGLGARRPDLAQAGLGRVRGRSATSPV